MKSRFLFILSLCFVVGCGSYNSASRKARSEYYSGHYTEAARELEKGAQEDGVDQLLYILDRATALHNAGEYDAAIKEFRRADKLAEISDYTSLSKEAATLVSNDKIIQYKGEDFEKVLISQYLAIDYLMMGNSEDAQVENRRVNRKLYLMITEGKRKYQLNPLAKYLSGIIYESTGQFNDAYIDYKAVFDLAPDFPYLREDLFRTAWKANLAEAMVHWSQHFSLTDREKEQIKISTKKPEVVVLVENGQSPEKEPHPQWHAIPKYFPRKNSVDHINLEIAELNKSGSSIPLFDIESTAIKNLDDKFAGLLAKRIAGVVAKEVIASEVDDHVSPLLGAALRLGMHMADQADCRSWLTLPKDFQIFRARLEPDKVYHLKWSAQGSGTVTSGGAMVHEKVLEVGKNALQKIFVPIRTLPN